MSRYDFDIAEFLAYEMRCVNYHCNVCGAFFDDPKIVRDDQWHGAEIGWERLTNAVCPNCGDDGFEEATKDDD